ncbi:hypothetical protein [Salinibacter altiplanensis]|uniref:hypothetical protein n=1 Tax=Salinibacter altiplanensis TaxID=1803181 RepID=UPI000C9F32D3|nr:hypothetical protein [Salinibacter altiplanensis]
MGHPAYNLLPDATPDATAAPADTEDIFVIHSSLTTELHQERALNVYEAFGRWTRHHGLTGRVLCGTLLEQPFRHLSVGLEVNATPSGELHEVYVVRERVLERRLAGGGDQS